MTPVLPIPIGKVLFLSLLLFLVTYVAGLPFALEVRRPFQPMHTFIEQLRDDNAIVARAAELKVMERWRHHEDRRIAETMRRAAAARARGNEMLAVHFYSDAIDVDPDFAEAWHMRAVAYFNMGQFMAALADLKQTVRLQPNHFYAYFGMGQTLLKLGQPDAAEKAFERAKTIYPHMSAAEKHLDFIATHHHGIVI